MNYTLFLSLILILLSGSNGHALTCDIVKDSFHSLSYSNNNGTQNWSTSWLETGELDGVTAGIARIRNDLCSSDYCLRIGVPSEELASSYNNRGVTRQVDLNNASSATLTFNYFTGVLTGSSSVTLAVSNNGGSNWTSLKTYNISTTNSSANPESFDITPYISANTQIRFSGSSSSASVTGMYIDDIEINYCNSISEVAPVPVLEYKFDACSLTNTVEDSQGNFNGTVTGTDSTASTSVLGGRSLDLTATDTSDWVTVPKSAIDGLDDFSFSIWIKTDISINQQEIFQAIGGSTDDEEFEIYLKKSDEIIINIKDKNETLSANKILTDNAWHHLILTRQGDKLCLYVDGAHTDCDTGVPTGQLSVSYTNTVVIGQEQDNIRSSLSLNSGFDSTQSFKGYIDELKIYKTVLSLSQVETLYLNESSGSNTSSSCSADLIASYNFDDDWVTNTSLTDQTGSYNGAPSGAVSQVSADASGSKGDTCYAGSFSGGGIDITGLPVSTSTGAKTSVSFWMKWDGTDNVMPMGWYKHDLWLVKGYFGYNTWNDDLTGISSSDLASGWHHVAAVFTNGSVSNNQLYIDGVLKKIASFGNSINATNAIVQSALRIGGVSSTTDYRFRGLLDNFKVYNGSITQAQVSADMNQSNACPSSDASAFAFNCVENGSNAITGKLYTKTTAQLFSFDVVALQDSNTVETNFANGIDHTVTVELVDTSSAGSCSTYPVLNPTVLQSLLFTSTDLGKKTSATMGSSTAYKAVKCRVTDATDSPSVVGCSTDSFSIRPTDFTLSSNLTNSGSSGLPKAKVGENFSLTATTSAGYTGTPKIDMDKLQAHVSAINVGTLTGSFNAANTGVATGTNFTYSEVGSLRFASEGIYDDSFTSIDPAPECTNDFSNGIVSGKVGCKFGNVATSNYFGRFTPDHFTLSENSLKNRSNLSCTPASSFTYSGEAFQTAFKLSAKNSNDDITQNYRGDYAKLDNSIINNFNFGAIDLADATTPLSATNLNLSLNLVSSSGAWINGVANITASLGLARTIINGPFESFNLGVAPADSDGIILSSYDLDTSVPANSNDRSLLATTKIRFGRLNIDNAHGSELLPLPVNLYTEYYNGNSFITHTDDSCTPINISHLRFNSGSNPITVGSGTSTASIANSPLIQGKAGLSLSSPGVNNIGTIDITSTAILTAFPWLSYDWDSDGSNDNSPSARVTFGIYKGNKKQIYFREIY